jgi:hypothetical protein
MGMEAGMVLSSRISLVDRFSRLLYGCSKDVMEIERESE